MGEAIFGEDFIRRLDTLRLALVRSAGSRSEGLRLAGRPGGTGEFRDHRDYAPGDEPRYIDWNLYGRLDRLFLKEFALEHEGRALVLLDASASMAAPGKFDFARRLAAAVGYLALAGGDRLAAVGFRGERAVSVVPRPGPAGFLELISFLERLEPAGTSGLRAAAERGAEAGAGRGPGAAVWISDFWTDPAAWADVAALAARGWETSLVRVLSPGEVAPGTAGPLELVDSETGRLLVVGGGEAAARAFESAAGEHARALSAFASGHRCQLLAADSSQPFETAALDLLRRGRLAEPRRP